MDSVRYEDTQTNPGDPFGAGVTMDRLVIRTNKEHRGEEESKHSFKKEVKVDSLAVYWQPQEQHIYRCEINSLNQNEESNIFHLLARATGRMKP